MFTLPQFVLLNGMLPPLQQDDPAQAAGVPAAVPSSPAPAAPPPAVPQGQSPGLDLSGVVAPQQSPSLQGYQQADMRQAVMDQLGSVGMALLAAGQRMSPEQRANILAGAAGSMGGVTRSALSNAQARLMNAQYQQSMDRQGRSNATLQAILQSDKYTPEEKAYAAADLNGFLAQKFNVANRRNPMQDQIDTLRQFGATDDQIRRKLIGDSRHYTNAGVYDSETNTFTPYPALMQGIEETPGSLPADRLAVDDVPIKPGQAFGVKGVWNTIEGAVRGVLGTETETNKANREAYTALTSHKNELNDALATTFDGRKTNYTIKRSDIMAAPDKFWTSPNQALEDFKVAQSYIEDQIAITADTYRQLQATSPTRAVAAREKLQQLIRVRDKNARYIENLGAELSGQVAPSLQGGATLAGQAIRSGRAPTGNSAVDSARQFLGE